MRMLLVSALAAVFVWAVGDSAGVAATSPADLAKSLKTLQAVEAEAQGSEAAQLAWAVVAKASGEQLPTI